MYQFLVKMLPPLQGGRVTSTALKWHMMWGEKTGIRPLGEPVGISGHLQCQFFPSYLTQHFSLHSSLLYVGRTCYKRDSFTLRVTVLSGGRDHSYTLQTCLVLTLWELQKILWHYRTHLFPLCFKLYLLTLPLTLPLFMWNKHIIILHLQ